ESKPEAIMESVRAECARCGMKDKACRSPEGQAPPYCPTIASAATIARTIDEYAKPGVADFARQASIQESECYADRGVRPYVLHPVKTRVQETCEFARRMGYRRLGVAFCAGLHQEARTLVEIFEAQGFEVVSVICKVGCTPKERIGLEEHQKVRVGEFESMCSPIVQAVLLDEAHTDFNILVGLCVGHDSLFLKYSHAPCTVLVTKDRVLGHAPAAALHTTSSYYAWLKQPR
ncbi:MAG: DUF1847 domain-containing protein, partial [Vicinamibacterales bacterium]